MLSGEHIPIVSPADSAADAIRVLNEKNNGAVLVVDEDNTILGIITDGDVRRAVVNLKGFSVLTAAQLMTVNPICIDGERLAADALSIMQKHEITALPIVDGANKLTGLLHLHNLLGKGEFRFLV
jgi:arabinose-5-phosphate isomerase